MKMIIKELNLKTALYDKVICESSSFQLEYDGVFYNFSVRHKQVGVSIHVSDGVHALSVFPQSANSIVIKGADYV